MVQRLVPCPACSRHVRVGERSCPFCQSALADSLGADPTPPSAPAAMRERRLSFPGTRRVALAGAAIGSSLLAVACGDQVAVPYGIPCDDRCLPPPVMDASDSAKKDAAHSEAGDARAEGGNPDGGSSDALPDGIKAD
jgi:hypothetical protein